MDRQTARGTEWCSRGSDLRLPTLSLGRNSLSETNVYLEKLEQVYMELLLSDVELFLLFNRLRTLREILDSFA